MKELPFPRSTVSEARKFGFTLIELLVSLFVFSLLMGMLAQMVSTTSSATTMTVDEMQAADGARRVFDALTTDLQNLANVNGLSVLYSQDATHNTSLVFLTQGRSPSGAANGRFIAVNYQEVGNVVTRSVSSVDWTTVNAATAATAVIAGGTPSTLSHGALRFQTVLLLDNGTTAPLPDSTAGTIASWETATVDGTQLPSGYYSLVRSTEPVDPQNPKVRGLAIGIATLDGETINLTNASQMSTALLAPTGSQTPVEAWEANRNAPVFQRSYPKPAIAALNLGQQIYILN